MRFTRTRLTLAVTAVMVVVWSSVASGANGNPIRAGRKTSATHQTILSTVESFGNGLQVKLGGTSKGAAVKGKARGLGVGVIGTAANANAIGVRGNNSAATHGTGSAGFFGGGHNNGVVGQTNEASSVGVTGSNTVAGVGVLGQSGPGGTGVSAIGGATGLESNVTDGGAVGIRSTAGSSANDAVQGNTSNGTGDAIQGITSGGAAFGVFAITSGGGTGVVSSSGPGTAVGASNGSATNPTVVANNSTAGGTAGRFTGTNALRVRPIGTSGTGLTADMTGDINGNGNAADDAENAIFASSDDTNNNAVITASSLPSPTCDEFTCEAIETFGFVDINGNARVTGNLDVVGTCCGPLIDDPLDPAHFYLRHASVASPDMKNIYDGVVTTNGRGRAVVNLPAYFPKLNRDFRYQLTVIGRSFAQAIVWKEIADGGRTFQIRTSDPNVKVSWQVTGIRNDAYARAHPLRVIQRKTGAAAGMYLHPELFGHPNASPLGLDLPTPGTTNKGADPQAQLQALIRQKVAQALRQAGRHSG